MKLRSIKEAKKLRGKKILLRVDFNVPLTEGKKPYVADDTRIVNCLPTIEYLLAKGASLIIVTHLGRPEGKVMPEFSIRPVAQRLERLICQRVLTSRDCISIVTKKLIDNLEPGQVLMLENVRFHAAEKKNNKLFAKKLAAGCDLYVNDAFANSHRADASMVAITNFLPSFAGLLLAKEVKELSSVLEKPKRPLVAIIGGVKISTKLAVIRNFLHFADSILFGGALANTVLKAKGIAVGRSIVEETMVKSIKKLNLTDTHLHIPVDVVVAEKISPRAADKIKAVGSILAKEYILDIGPDTVKLFDCIIREAKTIIWNGPMGVFEYLKFARGTEGVIHAILHSAGKIVIGGGETIEAVTTLKGFMHFQKPNIFISTGGGAMLEFLEGKMLPGIKPLIKK